MYSLVIRFLSKIIGVTITTQTNDNNKNNNNNNDDDDCIDHLHVQYNLKTIYAIPCDCRLDQSLYAIEQKLKPYLPFVLTAVACKYRLEYAE
jgi:hypothetical protein